MSLGGSFSKISGLVYIIYLHWGCRVVKFPFLFVGESKGDICFSEFKSMFRFNHLLALTEGLMEIEECVN